MWVFRGTPAKGKAGEATGHGSQSMDAPGTGGRDLHKSPYVGARVKGSTTDGNLPQGDPPESSAINMFTEFMTNMCLSTHDHTASTAEHDSNVVKEPQVVQGVLL